MGRFPGLGILAAALAAGQGLTPGSRVAPFTVDTVNFAAGKPTLVTFVSTKCPVSNAYNGRMSALYRDYAGRVDFLFVNSNANEPASEAAEHSRRVGFPFTVLKDGGNLLADIFGARSTPETYLIDSSGVVRYHGAVDDSQIEERVKVRAVRDALEAVLAGRQPARAEMKAFGCTIKRVRSKS